MNITKIHQKVNKPENISLNKLHQQIYALVVVAKSTASREKLNDLQLANSSTPLIRAFFVRSLRTPKENAFLKNKERSFLSMVGRIGQRLGVGCLPVETVSHPDTSYRPAVRSQAVAQKYTTGAITMLFKFLCVNRTKHTYNQEIITIQADTEENARFQLSADYRLLLDRPIAKISQNLTACNTQPRPTLGKVCGTAVHPTNTISFQVQGGIYA